MLRMKKPKMGRPAKDPTRQVVFARVPKELADALSAFSAEYNSTNPRTDKAAHVEFALIEYLTKRNHWPPQGRE